MLNNFIMTQWANIALVVAFIILCLFLIKRGYGYYVGEMLFYLVTEAEAKFGSGTGELKYAAVTTWMYEKLPTLAKLLFTRKQIDQMIEAAVIRLKKYLEENKDAQKLILPVMLAQKNL
jgi:hypothetical protein